MKGVPFFTVVIPTHNRADDLARAFESLAQQTFTNFEVIVGDNESTDHTPEVIEKYKKNFAIKHIYEKNWGGPARPRNNGIKAARGQWVCFLDSDDWWYKDKLARVHEISETSDLVYHKLDVHTPAGKQSKTHFARKLKAPVYQDLMLNGNAMANSSVCVRRELLLETGGFAEDKSIITAEDFDLWLRISQKTDRFSRINESLGAYWVAGSNLSGAIEKRISLVENVYQRHLPNLQGNERRQAEYFMNYVLGRMYHQIGDFGQARQRLKQARKTRNLEYKLKSYVLLSLMLFKS